MPVKKKQEEQHDPFKRPGNPRDEFIQAEDRASSKSITGPLAINAHFSYAQGGELLFDSPIVELIKFGEVLLARCDNDAMFVCNDGKTFHRFVFEIVPLNKEV